MDLIDFYREFHSTVAKYTFSSAAHGNLSKIDNILRHKTSFNKYKKIEITPYSLSDHNGKKLEFKIRETPEDIQTHGD
jgi:hypothetical protein